MTAVSCRYSKYFKQIVKSMLSEDEFNRPDFEELLKEIK